MKSVVLLDLSILQSSAFSDLTVHTTEVSEVLFCKSSGWVFGFSLWVVPKVKDLSLTSLTFERLNL